MMHVFREFQYLSGGAFANIYKAVDTRSNTDIALERQWIKDGIDELTVVKGLEHRYIIKMLGVGIEDKKKMLRHDRDVIGYNIFATSSEKMVYLVMELSEGTLHHVINCSLCRSIYVRHRDTPWKCLCSEQIILISEFVKLEFC